MSLKLYNRYLDAFLACANCGSFSRAAQNLFITPTALIKQINQFEEGIGCRLFDRNSKGLKLTAAGHILLQNSHRLIDCSESILSEIRHSTKADRSVINIGTSPVISGQYIIDWWSKVHRKIPNIGVRLIPFEDTPQRADQILFHLGEEIDMVAGVFDPHFLSRYDAQGLLLENVALGCSVPLSHPLSQKESLDLNELEGCELLVRKYDVCEDFDIARRYIEENYSKIHLIEINHLDLDAFNRAENNGQILLTIKHWSEVHPLFKTVTLNWSLTARFGLIFSNHPSEAVMQFVQEIQDISA